MPDGGLRADAAILPGPKHVAGIREQRADADRAHLGIDLAIHGEHGAALRVRAPVGEDKGEPSTGLPESRSRCGCRDLAGNPEILLLAERKVRLDRVQLRDRREEGRRPDEISDLSAGDRRHAIGERCDAGETEVQFCGLDRCLCRRDRRTRRVVRAHVVVQLILGNCPLFGQWLVTRQIALGLGELRLRLVQPGPCLGKHGFEGPSIDFEEQLTLPDEGTFLIRSANQIAGDLRSNLRVHIAVERSYPLARHGHLLRRQGHEGDRRRRRIGRRRRGILVATTGCAREERAGQEDGRESVHVVAPVSTSRMTRRTHCLSSGRGQSRSLP